MRYYTVTTHGYTEGKLTTITASYPAENAGDALKHHLKQNKHQDACKATVFEYFKEDLKSEYAITKGSQKQHIVKIPNYKSSNFQSF